MDEHEHEEVIAERTFDAKDGRKLSVYLFKPIVISNFESQCKYKVTGCGVEIAAYASGVDRLQAIMLSIARISMYVKDSDIAKSGDLSWLGDVHDFGLPFSIEQF